MKLRSSRIKAKLCKYLDRPYNKYRCASSLWPHHEVNPKIYQLEMVQRHAVQRTLRRPHTGHYAALTTQQRYKDAGTLPMAHAGATLHILQTALVFQIGLTCNFLLSCAYMDNVSKTPSCREHIALFISSPAFSPVGLLFKSRWNASSRLVFACVLHLSSSHARTS